MTGSLLWTPSPSRRGNSNLARFMASLNDTLGLNLESYADVHRFSIDEPDSFWTAVWDLGGVKAQARGSRALTDRDRMPGARFFPDARLNYAENMLVKSDDSPALVF